LDFSAPNVVVEMKHEGDCANDEYARTVCEGMYREKCGAVIALCETLRAVLALTGEDGQIRKIIEDTLAEYDE
jgi:hypothetical protein